MEIQRQALAVPESSVPWFHFSIDDVIASLIEVTDKNIPLFDHPFFALLNEMHNRYGAHVSLYLFYQKEIRGVLRNLSEVRDLTDELAAAGDWLHFGPHAFDFDTFPYAQEPSDQMRSFDQIYDQINRFAGKNTYATWVRLHFYSESYELAEYFTKRGVRALFTTDRPAVSYRLPEEERAQLATSGSVSYHGIHFVRTQFRVENLANDGLDETEVSNLIRDNIAQYGHITFYTHDYELEREEVRDMLKMTCAALHAHAVSSTKRECPILP